MGAVAAGGAAAAVPLPPQAASQVLARGVLLLLGLPLQQPVAAPQAPRRALVPAWHQWAPQRGERKGCWQGAEWQNHICIRG